MESWQGIMCDRRRLEITTQCNKRADTCARHSTVMAFWPAGAAVLSRGGYWSGHESRVKEVAKRKAGTAKLPRALPEKSVCLFRRKKKKEGKKDTKRQREVLLTSARNGLLTFVLVVVLAV